MILTTDELHLYKKGNLVSGHSPIPIPVTTYLSPRPLAGQAISSLIHMVNMCPDFYKVTYQRERIVRVDHNGGKFGVFADSTPYPIWESANPTEFASFCNTIQVERTLGGNIYGDVLAPIGVVGIEEWLTFGSIE